MKLILLLGYQLDIIKNMRIVPTSKEEVQSLLDKGIKERLIYSFFPADKSGCACQSKIQDLKNKFSAMRPQDIEGFKNKIGVFECPQDKTDLKRFNIYCNNCGNILGSCWASDETLSDWCDFHYICGSNLVEKRIVTLERYEGKPLKKGNKYGPTKVRKHITKAFGGHWEGALGVNISPIDERLGLECCCGIDTRDFRANMTLEEDVRKRIIEKNSRGKEFGKNDSAFLSVGI